MVLSNNEPAADGDQPVPLDKRYVTLGEHQLQPHDLLSQFLIRHRHPTSRNQSHDQINPSRRSGT